MNFYVSVDWSLMLAIIFFNIHVNLVFKLVGYKQLLLLLLSLFYFILIVLILIYNRMHCKLHVRRIFMLCCCMNVGNGFSILLRQNEVN